MKSVGQFIASVDSKRCFVNRVYEHHTFSGQNLFNAEIGYLKNILYEHLFTSERPDEEDDFLSTLNPDSLEVIADARVEPCLADARPGEKVPVRAAWLLRRGSGLRAGVAGVQPHGLAKGHLGEGQQGRYPPKVIGSREPDPYRALSTCTVTMSIPWYFWWRNDDA